MACTSAPYRIAVGPQAGRKVFTLQTLPGSNEPFDAPVGKVAGLPVDQNEAVGAEKTGKIQAVGVGFRVIGRRSGG